MKDYERRYHVHIVKGFDIKESRSFYLVYDYSWNRRFRAYSLAGLKRGLAMLQKDFDYVYSNWGLTYEAL